MRRALDARSETDDGATALHAAAYTGNAELVALLIDRGADDPKAPSPDIVQLLHARGIGPQRGN